MVHRRDTNGQRGGLHGRNMEVHFCSRTTRGQKCTHIFVGRAVFVELNIFATRKSSFLTVDKVVVLQKQKQKLESNQSKHIFVFVFVLWVTRIGPMHMLFLVSRSCPTGRTLQCKMDKNCRGKSPCQMLGCHRSQQMPATQAWNLSAASHAPTNSSSAVRLCAAHLQDKEQNLKQLLPSNPVAEA